MILASHEHRNDHSRATGTVAIGGGSCGHIPVRLNSVGEQDATWARFSLPPETLKTGAGFGRRPFPIAHPGSVCSSSSRPGAGGQQFVALPSRSLLPIQNSAHDLVCQDTYRSPVVHSKVSVRYANQRSERGKGRVPNFKGKLPDNRGEVHHVMR